MKADQIRALVDDRSDGFTTNLLQEIAAQLAEMNETQREALALNREDFELRNNPAKFIERMQALVPQLGLFMGSAMAAADSAHLQAKVEETNRSLTPAPRRKH